MTIKGRNKEALKGKKTHQIHETPTINWMDKRNPNILQELYDFEIDTDGTIPYDNRAHVIRLKNKEAIRIEKLMERMDRLVNNLYFDLYGTEAFQQVLMDIRAPGKSTNLEENAIQPILDLMGIPELLKQEIDKEEELYRAEKMQIFEGLEDTELGNTLKQMRLNIDEQLQKIRSLLVEWYLKPWKTCRHHNCSFGTHLLLPKGFFRKDQGEPEGVGVHCRYCASRSGRQNRCKNMVISDTLSDALHAPKLGGSVIITPSREELNKMYLYTSTMERHYIKRILAAYEANIPWNRKWCPKCKQYKLIALDEDMMGFILTSLRKINHPFFQNSPETTIQNCYINYYQENQFILANDASEFHSDKTRKDGYAIHCKDCAREHSKKYYARNVTAKKQKDSVNIDTLPIITEVLRDE